MEIFRKGTVFTEFRAINPKLCENCAFPQNFHKRKLGEITVFYAVKSSSPYCETWFFQKFFISTTVNEWNNLDAKIRNSERYDIFKNSILRFVGPSTNNVCNCHNLEGQKISYKASSQPYSFVLSQI